ncbi:MAG: DASS family sodium-coupled anion symporter [Sandaracinus sp.]|nr:DASS family sodium-coupled anion symporter [Sandaracinus sp.]MCB9624368.1 DASS family sodium-coupled anion symporter [Sandaracinus sp.]MCB9634286.1 DASS family sodium-coupled anion symporter [Sandaracinus sp.]
MKGWSRYGLAVAVVAALGVAFAPLGLEPVAQRLAAVFVAIVILWVTEALPVPVTALLIAPLLVATGVTDAKTAFAPYADPLLFLFVGGFFIARAMARHGLDRRLAEALVTSRWVDGRPRRMRFAFMAAAALLSMWISNTATAAILAPIVLGTFDEDDPRAGGALLGVAYACSLGGLGTVVGSPPNGITVRLLEQQADVAFGFLDWMAVGVPAMVLLFGLAYALSVRISPPGDAAERVKRDRGAWSRGEKATATAFGLAVIGWSVPELLETFGVPGGEALSKALPGGAVAIFAASVLFVWRDEKSEPVLPWSDAIRIDWGIILLFGGGISLGKQLFETGLAEVLARGFVAATGIESAFALLLAVTVFTIFFTEVCSNTASANMLVPIAIAIAKEIGVSPVPPALAVGLAASCAFMLPIATGPNAVVFGTGRVRQSDMMRKGLLLNLLAAVALVGLLTLWM